MNRRGSLSLLFLLPFLLAPAAAAQSVPNLPLYTRTVNVAAGGVFQVSDPLNANGSCNKPGTQYTLVVKNGNADGSGKVASGAVGVNGTDSCGPQLQAGQGTISADVLFGASGTVDIELRAPAAAPAVAVIELWRKPATLLYSGTSSYTTPKKTNTAKFPSANPALPGAMVITRTGGFAQNDVTNITLNGTVVATKSDFTVSGQTIRKSVTIAANNTLSVEATGASMRTDVTIEVVQTGGDTAAPVISVTAVPATVGTSAYTFTGTVTDAGSGVASLTLNGAAVSYASNGAFSAPVTLTPGANTFELVAYDCGGFGSKLVSTLWWDRNAPSLTVTTPQPNAFVNATTLAVAGSVADDRPGTPGVTVNGVAATVNGSGNWTASVPLTAGDGAKSLTIVATDGVQNATTVTLPVTLDATPPTITGTFSPPALANGWNRVGTTVTFTCADAGSGVATCTEPETITASGFYVIAGTATDKAGNQADAGVGLQVDAEPPTLTIDTHANTVRQSPLTISGTVTDQRPSDLGPDPSSGIAAVQCGTTAATISGNTFTCTAPLLAGANLISITAVDHAGNETGDSAAVRLDQRVPQLSITEPADATILNAAHVAVAGTVSDEDEVASLRVNGTAATFAGGEFHADVALVPGNNTITAEATDAAGNVVTRTVTVNRYIVPTVTITAPADLAVSRDTTATISGTVSDPAASVTVNGITAAMSNGNFTASGVPLAQGRTVITANAVTASGATATTSINLYRDSIPPRLEVYAPADNETVYASPVSISGMVDDIVVGTINAEQMRVTLNGVPAEVANRAFLLRDVVLNAGMNTFSITAVDAGGNTTVIQHHLTYVPAPPQPHLEIVSGNGQTGVIGTQLAASLVVRAMAPNATPLAGAMLTFEMAGNDGSVSDGTTEGRSVTVPTDANGRAQVRWTLGKRAGAGNQRVEVRGAGFAAPLQATAAARTGNPHLIVVDSGNNQFGIAADALPRPLIAIVVDSGNNRLADVPVTFTASAGGGSFNGQPAIVVHTDSDGRAVVRPTLGAEPGEDNNVFTATTAGVTARASFVASGRAAGPPAATSITGVILDNTTIPLAGVTVRLDGTPLQTQTDTQGQFRIAGSPVGYVKLFIDGSTAQRPGTWPTLEYALYTLPGVENSVGMPIYLVQLDTARGVFVDDTTGGTLTLPELPGFALEVKRGSATFPGGGRTGTVSATLVHADRIPMAPGFGQQPKFIVTIQPPGVHFDPPARLTLPNTDGLAPGASTEMCSFDHDLGQFVTIGSATVSADGSVVTADPGVGIIKGGWHSGGDPVPPGGGANCGPCKHFVGNSCDIDVSQNMHPFPDDGIPLTVDVCMNGRGLHVRPTLTVELTSPDNFVIRPDAHPPNIVATAHVDVPGVGNIDSSSVIRWKAHIYWDPPVRKRVEVHLNPGETSNVWRFAQSNAGGTLEVTATLVRNGRETISRKATARISGSFSERPAVVDAIDVVAPFAGADAADRLKRIACHESRQTLNNFDPARQNTPLISDDRNGVGIMQITPSAGEPDAPIDVYWNWRANVNVGLQTWYDKTRESNASIANARRAHPGLRDLTAAERLDDITRRYNSGKQYEYDPATKDWKLITNHANESYVCRVKFESDCFSGGPRVTAACTTTTN